MLLSLNLVLGVQIGAAYLLMMHELPPAVPALRILPSNIGSWKLASEQVMEPDVAAYLRPDDYINRTYVGRNPGAQVNLFIAYFKSLKSGYGPHSPGICLPGSGWMPEESGVVRLAVPTRFEKVPVNRYVLHKGDQRQLLIYWYQNDRRVWAEEFRAKLYMLPDLLKYRRSDVALVRIMVPIGRTNTEIPNDLLEFVGSAFPLLAERFATTQ
jgi:EpsI family protein